MSNLNTNTASLQAILDAVNSLPEAKADPVLQTKTVTPATEQQDVTPDSGYDGLSKVTVNAIPSDYVIPSGTKTITTNGTVDVKQYASVDVDVESSGTNISDSTITKETMVEGTVGYSSTGERLVGTNPYELNATNAEVAEQSDLLDQIYALLEAKSAYYTIYIGTDEPSVDLGVNGDIYIKRSE